MTKWYVKELSKLTNVSVQTLHHYDRINLLKPSLRLDNGYRVYSKQDLLRLQQIIALKFFGFELAQIKELLASELNMMEHFAAQSRLLELKAGVLLDASQKLQHIIANVNDDQSISWETIIESIEVYRMSQQFANSWEGKVFNQDELQQYVKFAKGLEQRFTPAEKEACHASWEQMVKDINANLHSDPASDAAVDIAKRVMIWVNNLYGKEYRQLRMTIWEKGFKGGHAAAEHGLTPEAVEWLDLAIDQYYRQRVMTLLAMAGKKPDAEVVKAWDQLMEEMYGDDAKSKIEAVKEILKDKNVSEAAKKLFR